MSGKRVAGGRRSHAFAANFPAFVCRSICLSYTFMVRRLEQSANCLFACHGVQPIAICNQLHADEGRTYFAPFRSFDAVAHSSITVK
jgi:hypothetical protein